MRCSAVCKPPSQAPQSSWPLFQMRPTSQERPAGWQSFPRTSYFCNKNQKRRGGSGHLWCDQVLGKVAMSANRKKFGLRQPQRTTVLYQHMKNWKCVNKSTISTISLYFLHVKQCKLRKEGYCSSSFHLCHLAFHPASGAKVRTASTTLTRLPQVSNLKPTQAEKKWWTIMEPMNWRSENHLCLSETHCILTVVFLIVFFDLCGLGTGTYHQRWSHWMGSTTRRRWSSPGTSQKLWGYGDPKGIWYMSQNEHAFCI